MSLSLSAPVLTPEEEENELTSLTVRERESIRLDLHGSSKRRDNQNHAAGKDSTTNTKRVISNTEKAKQAVEKEILNIPADLKKAYLEAVARCPEVVENESNATLFLYSEKLKPEKAARRLVEYWKLRRHLFGDDAFLPTREIEALSQYSAHGWSILPDDHYGRAVLFFDQNIVDELECKRDMVWRSLWFAVHRILERRRQQHPQTVQQQLEQQHQQQQQQDLVLLADVRCMYTVNSFDRKLERRVIDMCSKVLPVTVRAIHVCCSAHRSILEFVCPMFKKMLGKRLRTRLVLHQGDVTEELLASLEDYGLTVNGLPAALGGVALSSLEDDTNNHSKDTTNNNNNNNNNIPSVETTSSVCA